MDPDSSPNAPPSSVSLAVGKAYDATVETELTLRVGDIVSIDGRDDTGAWTFGWIAKQNDTNGWFPTECLSPSALAAAGAGGGGGGGDAKGGFSLGVPFGVRGKEAYVRKKPVGAVLRIRGHHDCDERRAPLLVVGLEGRQGRRRPRGGVDPPAPASM